MNARTPQSPVLLLKNSALVKEVEQWFFPIALALMFAGTLMSAVSVVQAVV